MKKPFQNIGRKAVVSYLLFAYWVTFAFAGSRPPFPFIPVGLGVLVAIVICIAVGIRAHRRGRYLPWEGGILTAGAAIVCIEAVAEAIVHIRAGGNYYYLRSLIVIPLVVALWIDERKLAAGGDSAH
ncbi:MAG: hypothetical protein V4582_25160 [Pseudomonadota bacterium]